MAKTRCDTCTKQQSCTIDMFKCTKEDYDPTPERLAQRNKLTRFGEVTQMTNVRRLSNGQSEIVGMLI